MLQRGSQSVWEDAVYESKKVEMVFKKLCKELLKIVDSCCSTFGIMTLCETRKQQVEIVFFLSKDILATQPFIPNLRSNYWLNPGAASISLFLGMAW